MQFTLIEFDGPGFVTADIQISEDRLILTFDTSNAPPHEWPPLDALQRGDNLWQQTCFELFIADADHAPYHELNLSPNGEWNCYAFDDYRCGMQTDKTFELRRLSLPKTHHAVFELVVHQSLGDHLRLTPSTVIQTANGELRYFALQHGDKPDFHDTAHHVFVGRDEL